MSLENITEDAEKNVFVGLRMNEKLLEEIEILRKESGIPRQVFLRRALLKGTADIKKNGWTTNKGNR